MNIVALVILTDDRIDDTKFWSPRTLLISASDVVAASCIDICNAGKCEEIKPSIEMVSVYQ